MRSHASGEPELISTRRDGFPTLPFTNPDYKVAQILSVLGSEVRLAILRPLLDTPKTVAEIVSPVGLNTTGQAYHHLRELERAGYVKQRERGRVYLTALAADAGAAEPEELPETPPEADKSSS